MPALDSVVEAQVREAQIEGHAALLFLNPAIRIRSGQRGDERGLSVIDVTRRPDDVHAIRRRDAAPCGTR